jgi:MFS family permease
LLSSSPPFFSFSLIDSNNDAGTFGAVIIVCGLVGAIVMGKLMEKTKAYVLLLRVGVLLVCFSVFFLMAMLFAKNYWPLTIAFGFLGFFSIPLLPILIESCAESIYPISEEVSFGLLNIGMFVSMLSLHYA